MHNAMEQTRFWMWTRRKSGERPLFGSSIQKIASGSPCKESWEEKAFAVDSAGHLGGCVWPPRSYSCSFCRREFRSAQALGGHMNVHRRERARLKQSSSPARESHDTNQHHHHGTCTPLGTWSLDQAGSPVCKSNPNPIYCGVIASVLSPKVSAASTRENSESSLVSPPYSSTIIQENPMKSLSTATRSLADPTTSRQLNLPEFKLGRESLKLREVGLRASRNPSDDEETISSKRRQRTDPWFPFLEGASSDGQQKLHSEVLKFSPCPDEEIDLELRLGHSANDK